MRVLHVIPSIARQDGGPTEVVRQLHDALGKLGVTSSILTTDKGLPDDKSKTAALSGLHLAQSAGPQRLNFARDFGSHFSTLMEQTDVVHVHAVDAYTSSVAARLTSRASKPFVLQPHGAYDPYHRRQGHWHKVAWFRILDSRAFGRASSVIASSSIEAAGVKAMGLGPIDIIPLGVGPELFDLADDRAGTNILFLGRITQKKRVDLVIQAFAASGLATKGMKLVVAGPIDPRLKYSPSDIAISLGVADAVAFVGTVDGVRRKRLLAQADLFLLPSEDESFGISVAEAMAAGLPAIVSPHVGVGVDASHAKAVAVARLDQDAIATEMLRLMNDVPARLEVGAQARIYAAENFNWDVVASRFKAVYEHAVSNG